MPSTAKISGEIDVLKFEKELPDSLLFAKLGNVALTSDRSGYDGWWDDLRTEYDNGTLPTEAAVAAYFAVIKPIEPRSAETEVIKRVSMLNEGTLVIVKNMWNLGGELSTDATAMLGHPISGSQSYASVSLGLQFKDRKNIAKCYPTTDFLIGEEEIRVAYKVLIENSDIDESFFKYDYIPAEALRATALVDKLGVFDMDNEFRTLCQKLVQVGLRMINPERIIQREIIDVGLLEYFHQLDPEKTNYQITQLAKSPSFIRYKDELSQVQAAILSPYILESLTPDEQQMWIHTAAAGLYQMRVNK